jgi:SAM-dependent methyltransferase
MTVFSGSISAGLLATGTLPTLERQIEPVANKALGVAGFAPQAVAMSQSIDHRRSAPSALRNREPILAVLRGALPEKGTVLELASGTGEHVLHFARQIPHLVWQPSDPSAEARASVAAWLEAEGLANVRAPIDLDASRPAWPIEEADAILAINLVHISPWRVTVGLIEGAKRLLPVGGLLYLYGPYRQRGHPLAASNAAFDADLRRRNPEWGLRDVAEVTALATQHGLTLENIVEMPANNLSLLFRAGSS